MLADTNQLGPGRKRRRGRVQRENQKWVGHGTGRDGTYPRRRGILSVPKSVVCQRWVGDISIGFDVDFKSGGTVHDLEMVVRPVCRDAPEKWPGVVCDPTSEYSSQSESHGALIFSWGLVSGLGSRVDLNDNDKDNDTSGDGDGVEDTKGQVAVYSPLHLRVFATHTTSKSHQRSIANIQRSEAS
jgi:hypothetical protein